MDQLIIIGAGGFGSEVAWIAAECNWGIAGFADADETKRGAIWAGYRVYGNLAETATALQGQKIRFICAIGDNERRREMASAAEKSGWEPVTVIHPSALVAPSSNLGRGTFVGPGAIVSNNARIGNHVIINLHVSVGHDSVIEDFCQLSPGSRTSGFCRMEELSFLGTNAVLLPATTVGRESVVGACSFARGIIASRTTVLGVPSRAVRDHRMTTGSGA